MSPQPVDAEVEDDEGTTTCCGDYHYADCPMRTAAFEADREPDPDDYDNYDSDYD